MTAGVDEFLAWRRLLGETVGLEDVLSVDTKAMEPQQTCRQVLGRFKDSPLD